MAKITRLMRMRMDQLDAAAAKSANAKKKTSERARRNERMISILRDGSLPYPPHVMSWLSRKLDKRSSKITQEEVSHLLK